MALADANEDLWSTIGGGGSSLVFGFVRWARRA
jgi:hypothetical protein